MQVDVDIKDESGNQLGNVQNTVYETDVFAKYGDEADAEIARIIAQNAGGGAAGGASAPTPAAKLVGRASNLM